VLIGARSTAAGQRWSMVDAALLQAWVDYLLRLHVLRHLLACLISHGPIFFSHNKSALVDLSTVKTISRTTRMTTNKIEKTCI
jgi:hypothetical protein